MTMFDERLPGVEVAGCEIVGTKDAKDTPKDAQRTGDLWITSDEVAQLLGIDQRNARRAMGNGSWRGHSLIVREVKGGAGRGGKTLQLYADSLPPEARSMRRGASI